MSIENITSNLRILLAQTLQRPFEIESLADKGLAHWHVRLNGTGLLARIPKQSQMCLGALDNILYEAACFKRAAACGHVPRLERILLPSHGLPWGALLVEEITGSPANNPAHIAPIMQSLASLHALPVPSSGDRLPLLNEKDPLLEILTLVRAQAIYLDQPLISEASRGTLKSRLDTLSGRIPHVCVGLESRLITFDAHPGNFLITPSGKAVLVDLEKLRYSYPPLDLAHATLYTSTTWDVDASFTLTIAQVAHAYEVWVSAVGNMAEPYLVAFVPLRELMWLWSVTWCAKWLVESVKPQRQGSVGGENWSQAQSDATLIRHVGSRVNDYLSFSTINQVLAEFDELDRLFTHSS